MKSILIPSHGWRDRPVEAADDVFVIDPVGAGYSRATRPDLAAKFLNLNGDLDSVGEFIRMYLTRHERWASPLFLLGESYGTTRASGLSGLLVDCGIAFNGILLISTIMNFQTARFAEGNDLPLILILPSYTATEARRGDVYPDQNRQSPKPNAETIWSSPASYKREHFSDYFTRGAVCCA